MPQMGRANGAQATFGRKYTATPRTARQATDSMRALSSDRGQDPNYRIQNRQ